MARRSFRFHLLTLLASLAAMLLVLGQGVEAAACAWESAPAESVSQHADHGPGACQGEDAGHAGDCAHGHCHHGASGTPPLSGEQADPVFHRADRASPAEAALMSRHPDRLTRPPRS